MTYILVVDDDAAIRNVVADILELSDFPVKVASNGVEALNYLRAEQPAAVLLDLMMPIMDGPEFLRRVRRDPESAALPVVIMSAARDAPQVAEQMDAQGFLPKPFELDNMLAAVMKVAPGLSQAGAYHSG